MTKKSNFFEDTREKIKDTVSDLTGNENHKQGRKGGSQSSKGRKRSKK